MADTDSSNAAGISPDALAAAAARLRRVETPDRGAVAAAPRDPYIAAMERAMDRMGPIPGRDDSSGVADSEWDEPPAADSPKRAPAAASLTDDLRAQLEARRQAISGEDREEEEEEESRTPEVDSSEPLRAAPARASVADDLGEELAARRQAISGEDREEEEEEQPASPDDVLQQRLADRRRAISGDEELEQGEWGQPDVADVSFELQDALAQSPDAELDREDAQALQQEVKASLEQQGVSPPAPADVPPPPQVPWQQVGPAQAVAPAGVPPPLPSRGASPQPPGAAPAQPQAKLPLLTDEQNKTYAAQLEHQQATMGRVNAFLGTPEGKNVDRVTTAMVTAMVTERGTVQNLPYSLQHLEAQKLPPDQQRAEVDKLLGKASDYDQKLDRLEGRADRISTGRDPGPDLPLSSRAEYEAFANRGERMRGLLVRCDRAMDPKAPVQPDAAMQKQTMEMLNANRYMLDVPRQLKELEAKNLDPGTRSAEVAKVMTPMPEIDKRMDGMNKTLKDFSVAQLGDRAPKPLPGLTPDQQAEFADRSARMRGMLNHLDRMMDPKAPRQPDAAMKTQTLELLNANRYMLNLPSELKEIDKQNLDPATKQAQIDKLMAPMAVVDKRMDATAKSINDFYVGKDRPPAQLAGVTQEQNKEYALRSRRMDAMLEGLDRMNDPKLPIQPSKTMQKETLELLRANTHLKELPKNLERLDAQNLDPAAKQAQIDLLMAPMAEIDKRMSQMDRRMIGQAADIEAAEQRGRFGRFVDRVKEYGSRAVEAIKSIPDRISERFSSQAPTPGVGAQAVAPQTVQPPAPATPIPGQAAAAQVIPGAAIPAPPPRGDIPAPPPMPPLPPLPARTDSPVPNAPAAHLTVQMGPDEQHVLPKGVGFQTSGVVDSVEHKDGAATVHYKLGSHPEVIKVDEQSPLAEAVDHLKPGDKFDMKINREADKHEALVLEDKRDHFQTVLRDTGVVEKGIAPSTPAPDHSRSAGR